MKAKKTLSSARAICKFITNILLEAETEGNEKYGVVLIYLTDFHLPFIPLGVMIECESQKLPFLF